VRLMRSNGCEPRELRWFPLRQCSKPSTSPFMSRYDYRECGRDRSGANLYRFGAFNPAGAAKQGVYMINSMGAAAGGEGDGGQVDLGLFGSVNVEPRGSKWYRSQVTAAQLDAAIVPNTRRLQINYEAVFPPGHPDAGLPVLNMLKGGKEI